MSQKTFLVTGATGSTGGHTVNLLLERGYRVRAVAHRQDERSRRLQERGVEVVYGDLLDFDFVLASMQGVEGAYFCYPIRPGILQATAYLAQAAKRAGAKIVVNMSQISAREDAKSQSARDHWLAERVFDGFGVPVAHLRPTYFAEWFLHNAAMVRQGLLQLPFGTGKHAPIPAEDQARVIAGILENPEQYAGQVYPLYGPVEYTHQEIVEVIGRVLGKRVDYRQISVDEWRALVGAGGDPKDAAGGSAGKMYGEFEPSRQQRVGDSFFIQHLRQVAEDHQNGLFAGTNEVVEKIGGQKPMTLEQFVERHRAVLA